MSSKTSLWIATVNVRMDGNHDHPVAIPQEGTIPRDHRKKPWESAFREHPWPERRSRLVDAILATGPVDVIGFQEVYHNQLMDLAELLGPDYDHVGVGRNDGKEAGEYSPIFYDKTKFELVRWKTVWLSPTPEVPGSKGWDADQTRIATLCTLTILTGPEAGGLLHAVNTHYDHIGVRARAESSLLIREQIASWVLRFEDPNSPTPSPKSPVILFGDFNSPPEELGYKFITSHQALPNGLPSFTFLDSYAHLRLRGANQHGLSAPYGPEKTFTGFAAPGRAPTTRIDFVMLASAQDPTPDAKDPKVSDDDAGRAVAVPEEGRGGWKVARYACIDNWIEERDADGWMGRWSDHRAVKVRLDKI